MDFGLFTNFHSRCCSHSFKNLKPQYTHIFTGPSVFKVMAINEDQARWEKNLKFFILSVDVEDNHRHDFNIMCNGKCLVVTVCPAACPDGTITSLLSRYDTAFSKDGGD